MGYEETRFTHQIDEEFHCSICGLVLKDPMQSPCEHLFCNECIRGSLAVDESCPVECGPLKLEDIKPAPRAVRNFVNKFEIKCDFESKGCAEIVKLEKLDDHVARCEHNPNAKVICDKGCNIEMCRQEYETKNCFVHLADRVVCLSEEVTSLRRQQEDYDDKVAMINDEVKRKSEAIEALNDELNRRGVEIERLNEDLNRIRSRDDEFVFNEEICSLRSQSEQSGLLEEEIEYDETEQERHEFRVKWDYGRISIVQSVMGDGWYYDKLIKPLGPTKFLMKFKILRLKECIQIGLGEMCSSSTHALFPIAYISDGWSNFNFESGKIVSAWKVGDIIEFGINFPSDFDNDGRDVRVFINKNGKLIGEQLVAMPIDGLLSTLFIPDGSRIKYLSN